MPPRSHSSDFDPPRETDVPATLTGEFYCAPEDVTRGVSMAAEPPHGALGGHGVSDFYHEPDHMTRGVSMVLGLPGAGDYYAEEPHHRGVSMAHPSPFGLGADVYGNYDFAEPDQLLKGSLVGRGEVGSGAFLSGLDGGASAGGLCQPGLGPEDPPFKGLEGGVQGEYSILGGAARFQESQRPPRLPADASFALEEATTLRLSLSRKFEPSKIGNDLLDFLEASVVATVLKVNPAKFTVKANVFVEARMCAIKARVYHTGGSEYALEMQRRSGDAVVFGATFQQAAKYFDERLYFSSTPPAAAAAPTALAKPAAPPADVMDLQPMLDMAAMEEPPSLQAEAAAALAEFVAFQPSAALVSLCSEASFDRIRRLLQSERQDVAYPTAQLLAQLAKMSEAGPFVADHSFAQLVVDKLCSKESSLLIRTEFTKVANTIVQQHTDKLSSRAKDSFTAALGKATGPGPSNSKLGPELQAAGRAALVGGGVGGGAVF